MYTIVLAACVWHVYMATLDLMNGEPGLYFWDSSQELGMQGFDGSWVQLCVRSGRYALKHSTTESLSSSQSLEHLYRRLIELWGTASELGFVMCRPDTRVATASNEDRTAQHRKFGGRKLQDITSTQLFNALQSSFSVSVQRRVSPCQKCDASWPRVSLWSVASNSMMDIWHKSIACNASIHLPGTHSKIFWRLIVPELPLENFTNVLESLRQLLFAMLYAPCDSVFGPSQWASSLWHIISLHLTVLWNLWTRHSTAAGNLANKHR